MSLGTDTYIVPVWKCISDGCKERAIWGTDWVPEFCQTHKHSESLESLTTDRCKLCRRIFIVNKDKHCKPCSQITEKKEVKEKVRELDKEIKQAMEKQR
jgi:hypothetical protein